MFGHHHHQSRPHFGFGVFEPHRRWADGEPPPEWPFGRFGRRWGGCGGSHQGPGGPGERFFGRGDLKYVILDLLKDQPRHGYDIIRALEDRMGGQYRPSPGSVYPTLQMLEDLGYVTSSQQEGKKVYSKLKYESGVHRVQRVPDTETQGRTHTSAATVAVRS